jgi:FkbM family methyltransferase
MPVLKSLVNKTLLNWERPIYSPALYKFCMRYLDLWYGDNNFDRTTNGEYRILKMLIPKATVVFDVGANVGDYSGEILSINPSVSIHAFEPDIHAFTELAKLPLTANNIALGDKIEKRMLYRGDEKTTHNSFYNVHARSIAPLEVPTSTLDAYCIEHGIKHIDFLKVDVEGFEFMVLKGAEDLFRRGAVDYVQFEFSGATIESRTFLKDFLQFFSSYGYDLYRIRATSVDKVDYRPDSERFTLTNYLAVKKGLPIP